MRHLFNAVVFTLFFAVPQFDVLCYFKNTITAHSRVIGAVSIMTTELLCKICFYLKSNSVDR